MREDDATDADLTEIGRKQVLVLGRKQVLLLGRKQVLMLGTERILSSGGRLGRTHIPVLRVSRY